MGVVRETIISLMRKDRDVDSVLKIMGLDGGPGSGNFAHAGRPGQVGGSAKRGGGGGGASGGSSEGYNTEGYKAKVKEISKQRKDFKKKSKTEKIKFGIEKGFLPSPDNESAFNEWKSAGQKKGLSSDKYIDYCAARYFTIEKFKPVYERKTPLKSVEKQEGYINSDLTKISRIMNRNGVNQDVARRMLSGLENHFGDPEEVDPWIDKFIESDGRYEGAIYRWKTYDGTKKEEKLKELVPGAKIGNMYGSNWSFSSDPMATRGFGKYDSSYYTSFLFVVDDNKTASPVQCFSSFDSEECEVIPHSETTWTIQSVEKKTKPKGGEMYEIHMTEDDWHEEKKIPVWEPDESEKGEKKPKQESEKKEDKPRSETEKKEDEPHFETKKKEIKEAPNLPESVKNDFDVIKNEVDYQLVAGVLDKMPVHTKIDDGYGEIFEKLENGKWKSSDSVVEYGPDSMWLSLGSKSTIIEYPQDGSKEETKPPKETKLPKSYAEAHSKLNDFEIADDRDGLRDYLSTLPLKTEFYDFKKDSVWTKTEEGWKSEYDGEVFSDAKMSEKMCTEGEIEMHGLPFPKPKDKEEAQKQFTDIVKFNKNKVVDFIKESPDGTLFYNPNLKNTAFLKSPFMWLKIKGFNDIKDINDVMSAKKEAASTYFVAMNLNSSSHIELWGDKSIIAGWE